MWKFHVFYNVHTCMHIYINQPPHLSKTSKQLTVRGRTARPHCWRRIFLSFALLCASEKLYCGSETLRKCTYYGPAAVGCMVYGGLQYACIHIQSAHNKPPFSTRVPARTLANPIARRPNISELRRVTSYGETGRKDL